jgi:hypothetical protein
MTAPPRSGETLTSLRGRWWVFFQKRCLAGFPWFLPGHTAGQNAMVEARRIVRRHFGREHHLVLRTIAQILATAAWPAAVLVNLWQLRGLLGSDAMPTKRAPEALWAAMRHNILPSEYYAYGLWRRDRKINIDNYLYSNECARLFKVLNRPSQVDPIDDKLAFYELCQAHAVPTPAILAAFAPTGKLVDFQSGLPPKRDLFVKPRTGLGGNGTERFRWDGLLFESNRGSRIGREKLGDYLATRAHSENRTLLVQPLLSSHPDLRAEANEALATARLVTGRSRDGEITAIFAVISFARANQITSHSNHVALIDHANGRLISAPPQNSPGISIYDYRELASIQVCGLPDWDAALQYIKVMHQACANFVFVGWDVAFTEYGPMILEGNANWCADTYQTLSGKPLGATKFAEILETQIMDASSKRQVP